MSVWIVFVRIDFQVKPIAKRSSAQCGVAVCFVWFAAVFIEKYAFFILRMNESSANQPPPPFFFGVGGGWRGAFSSLILICCDISSFVFCFLPLSVGDVLL